MAFPLPRGVTASEIAFLAEMETVTIVPRQRLDGLELLGVCSPGYLKSTQLIMPRALLKHLLLRDAQTSPYGSPFSSNANAAPTSYRHHGYIQSHWA